MTDDPKKSDRSPETVATLRQEKVVCVNKNCQKEAEEKGEVVLPVISLEKVNVKDCSKNFQFGIKVAGGCKVQTELTATLRRTGTCTSSKTVIKDDVLVGTEKELNKTDYGIPISSTGEKIIEQEKEYIETDKEEKIIGGQEKENMETDLQEMTDKEQTSEQNELTESQNKESSEDEKQSVKEKNESSNLPHMEEQKLQMMEGGMEERAEEQGIIGKTKEKDKGGLPSESLTMKTTGPAQKPQECGVLSFGQGCGQLQMELLQNKNEINLDIWLPSCIGECKKAPDSSRMLEKEKIIEIEDATRTMGEEKAIEGEIVAEAEDATKTMEEEKAIEGEIVTEAEDATKTMEEEKAVEGEIVTEAEDATKTMEEEKAIEGEIVTEAEDATKTMEEEKAVEGEIVTEAEDATKAMEEEKAIEGEIVTEAEDATKTMEEEKAVEGEIVTEAEDATKAMEEEKAVEGEIVTEAEDATKTMEEEEAVEGEIVTEAEDATKAMEEEKAVEGEIVTEAEDATKMMEEEKAVEGEIVTEAEDATKTMEEEKAVEGEIVTEAEDATKTMEEEKAVEGEIVTEAEDATKTMEEEKAVEGEIVTEAEDATKTMEEEKAVEGEIVTEAEDATKAMEEEKAVEGEIVTEAEDSTKTVEEEKAIEGEIVTEAEDATKMIGEKDIEAPKSVDSSQVDRDKIVDKEKIPVTKCVPSVGLIISDGEAKYVVCPEFKDSSPANLDSSGGDVIIEAVAETDVESKEDHIKDEIVAQEAAGIIEIEDNLKMEKISMGSMEKPTEAPEFTETSKMDDETFHDEKTEEILDKGKIPAITCVASEGQIISNGEAKYVVCPEFTDSSPANLDSSGEDGILEVRTETDIPPKEDSKTDETAVQEITQVIEVTEDNLNADLKNINNIEKHTEPPELGDSSPANLDSSGGDHLIEETEDVEKTQVTKCVPKKGMVGTKTDVKYVLCEPSCTSKPAANIETVNLPKDLETVENNGIIEDSTVTPLVKDDDLKTDEVKEHDDVGENADSSVLEEVNRREEPGANKMEISESEEHQEISSRGEAKLEEGQVDDSPIEKKASVPVVTKDEDIIQDNQILTDSVNRNRSTQDAMVEKQEQTIQDSEDSKKCRGSCAADPRTECGIKSTDTKLSTSKVAEQSITVTTNETAATESEVSSQKAENEQVIVDQVEFTKTSEVDMPIEREVEGTKVEEYATATQESPSKNISELSAGQPIENVQLPSDPTQESSSKGIFEASTEQPIQGDLEGAALENKTASDLRSAKIKSEQDIVDHIEEVIESPIEQPFESKSDSADIGEHKTPVEESQLATEKEEPSIKEGDKASIKAEIEKASADVKPAGESRLISIGEGCAQVQMDVVDGLCGREIKLDIWLPSCIADCQKTPGTTRTPEEKKALASETNVAASDQSREETYKKDKVAIPEPQNKELAQEMDTGTKIPQEVDTERAKEIETELGQKTDVDSRIAQMTDTKILQDTGPAKEIDTELGEEINAQVTGTEVAQEIDRSTVPAQEIDTGSKIAQEIDTEPEQETYVKKDQRSSEKVETKLGETVVKIETEKCPDYVKKDSKSEATARKDDAEVCTGICATESDIEITPSMIEQALKDLPVITGEKCKQSELRTLKSAEISKVLQYCLRVLECTGVCKRPTQSDALLGVEEEIKVDDKAPKVKSAREESAKGYSIVNIRTRASTDSLVEIVMSWAGGDLSLVDIAIRKVSKTETELKVEAWTPVLGSSKLLDTKTANIGKESESIVEPLTLHEDPVLNPVSWEEESLFYKDVELLPMWETDLINETKSSPRETQEIKIDLETWGFPTAFDERYGDALPDFFPAARNVSLHGTSQDSPSPGQFTEPSVLFAIIMDEDNSETRIKMEAGKSKEDYKNFVFQYEDSVAMNKSCTHAMQFYSSEADLDENNSFNTEVVLASPNMDNIQKVFGFQAGRSGSTVEEMLPVFKEGLGDQYEVPENVPEHAVLTNFNFNFQPKKRQIVSSEALFIECCKLGMKTTFIIILKEMTATGKINSSNPGQVTYQIISNGVQSAPETNIIGPDKAPLSITIPLGTIGQGLMKVFSESNAVSLLTSPALHISTSDSAITKAGTFYSAYVDGKEKSEVKNLLPGNAPLLIQMPFGRRQGIPSCVAANQLPTSSSESGRVCQCRNAPGNCDCQTKPAGLKTKSQDEPKSSPDKPVLLTEEQLLAEMVKPADYPPPVEMIVPLKYDDEEQKPLAKPPSKFGNINKNFVKNISKFNEITDDNLKTIQEDNVEKKSNSVVYTEKTTLDTPSAPPDTAGAIQVPPNESPTFPAGSDPKNLDVQHSQTAEAEKCENLTHDARLENRCTCESSFNNQPEQNLSGDETGKKLSNQEVTQSGGKTIPSDIINDKMQSGDLKEEVTEKSSKKEEESTLEESENLPASENNLEKKSNSVDKTIMETSPPPSAPAGDIEVTPDPKESDPKNLDVQLSQTAEIEISQDLTQDARLEQACNCDLSGDETEKKLSNQESSKNEANQDLPVNLCQCSERKNRSQGK